MYEANFIHGCMSILGSLAMIAIIVTALATIVGLVKPADALKYCGVIAGIVIVTILIVSVLVGLWSSMSLWQRVILAVILFGVWRLRQERRQPRKKNEGE
jgi:membrane protein implicated in regulation of membrane protease activity